MSRRSFRQEPISRFDFRRMKGTRAIWPVSQPCDTRGRDFRNALFPRGICGYVIQANVRVWRAPMEKRAVELEAEVARWLEVAEASDAEEDKLHGAPAFEQFGRFLSKKASLTHTRGA